MQDIRKYIDLIEDKQEPQVGDAFDIEFGNDNRAIISSVIEQIDNDSIILRADEKAMSFISNLEESCGCEMPQEETAEKDHEVGMGKSQMYHAMKNAKAIHDILQKISEREGIEGWVASKLTKASDYLKVVKDYLEYEMVQSGFEKNQESVNEDEKQEVLAIMAKHPQATAKLKQTGDLMDVYSTDLYYDLFTYFQDEMPYGTQKARDGDPVEYIHNELDNLGLIEAKYQGRTVKLNKPQRTGTDEPGKFKVYVKDPKTGNVKMVRFGHQGGGKNKDSKTMRIKKSNAARRKSFRARHNCSNPGPKTKARYWSCRAW